jgi:hypothetical protein
MKRIYIFPLFLIIAVSINFLYGINSWTEKEMLVKIQASKYLAKDLLETGVYIYEIGDNYITGAVTEPILEKIASRGYQYEILIPDMVKYHEAIAPGENFAQLHSYQEIVDTFNIIAQNNPNLVHLDTIGYSVANRLLLAMKITDNPNIDEHEPRIIWDGATHGNENIGTDVCLHLIRYLLQNYWINPTVANWVNTREIWIIPIVNPDGMVARVRTNNNGADLNRDYGYIWDTGWGSPAPWSQPEIIAIRNFAQQAPFVMWTSYHSGTTAAMWPWGYSTMAPYDSIIMAYLCQRYSYHTSLPAFQICRGLYEVHGSSADYGYGSEGAIMICPEICSPWIPDTTQIPNICQTNLNANLELINRCDDGIRGRVYDSITGEPVKAIVEMQPPAFPIYTDTQGYYFRYAHQGTYSIKVTANGYAVKTIPNIQVPTDSFTICDISLVRDTTIPLFAYKCISCDIKDPASHTNQSLTCFALGRPDNRRFSLGVRGWAIFDMQRPIINGPGYDFTVYEGDADPEACSIYVSNNWNGPWSFCGFDTGTSYFDLSATGVGMARYIRIADDGDGTNNATGGFDIDAIEAVIANVPAFSLVNQTIYDSTGNNNGRFDAGENIELVLSLRNLGRRPAYSVIGTLSENDPYIIISDSTGMFGDILSDSTRNNNLDRFALSANPNTPTEHIVNFVLRLNGTGYSDSVLFSIPVGEFIITDPIPDGPREPALYWAYDNVDTMYSNHPDYNWVEIKTIGTRLSYAHNDQVKLLDLPAAFGPWKFYGNRYTQVSISADGWVALGFDTTRHYANTGIPDPALPNGYVALNWDDLNPTNTGSGGIYYYHDIMQGSFIIEYDSVRYYNPSTVYDKFELIIYDTTTAPASGNNIIVAQYMTANRYESSTIGIEDSTGTIGIQCLYNEVRHRGCAPWTQGKAIKYTTDAPIQAIADLNKTAIQHFMKIYPNPFRNQVSINVTGFGKLNIYDINGRLVKSFANPQSPNPNQQLIWDGKDNLGKKLPTGIYFAKLETNIPTLHKIVLTR